MHKIIQSCSEQSFCEYWFFSEDLVVQVSRPYGKNEVENRNNEANDCRRTGIIFEVLGNHDKSIEA